MKRNYIGLSTTMHDSALAIVDHQGTVVFAEATERYLQYKKAINCSPDLFVRVDELVEAYCDPEAEWVVAHSWSADYPAMVEKELARFEGVTRTLGDSNPFFLRRYVGLYNYILRSQARSVAQAEETLTYALSQDRLGYKKLPLTARRYNHHDTHAASACFTSPFEEGVARSSMGWGRGKRFASIDTRMATLRGFLSNPTRTSAAWATSTGRSARPADSVCSPGRSGRSWAWPPMAASTKASTTCSGLCSSSMGCGSGAVPRVNSRRSC